MRAVESPQVDRHPGLRELNDESAGVDPDVRQKFWVRIDPRLLQFRRGGWVELHRPKERGPLSGRPIPELAGEDGDKLCRARDYPHCDVAATPTIQDIDQFGAEFAAHRTTVTIGRRDGALDIRHLCLIY